MSFWANRRRKATKGFNTRDLAGWRRLVREARRAVRNPGRYLVELEEAAASATKCVMPPGHVYRDGAFSKLIERASGYARAVSGEARAALALDLEIVAQQCAEALETPRPAPRPRKDLE